MSEILDLIICGGGAAGLTSAVYAARSGLDFVLIDISSSMGSQITQTSDVDNYTGFEKVNGMELVMKFYEHANALNAPMINDEVQEISKENGIFTVRCAQGEYKSRTVIYCSGASHRELGVKGEKELLGKGVGYCAVCDGFFYRNKTVVVVGGGNTAVTDALYLSKICKKVILVHRRDSLRAEKILTERLENAENVEIMFNSEVAEILGKKSADGILLKSGEKVDCDGVFIAVGIVPRSDTVKNLAKIDNNGYIVADESGKTSLNGLFAAGDVRTKELRQIITACSDGANCVDSVNKFLDTL
ncbi:FAD-dependent oxidoreductase [Ruminococcus sp.]|uniref:NAD(P)/FAD-dependent oxidoreductase n=1 Tax=Ruminococcus sp. TaxID=41978 RepID=UPI002604C8CB|nr:FAD-dependent oxidoreductase [Ruminococcus sp.]MDD6988923.1 FAD-dependent oxidoreductase [Ruminococcus sp.]MDY6201674.1 FAD-dependent oxidoreductase [Ruminococcus sp.]